MAAHIDGRRRGVLRDRRAREGDSRRGRGLIFLSSGYGRGIQKRRRRQRNRAEEASDLPKIETAESSHIVRNSVFVSGRGDSQEAP